MPRGRKPKVKINLQTYLLVQVDINYLAKDANGTWHGFSNHPGILRHKSIWLSIKMAHTSYELKNVDTSNLDYLNLYWEQSPLYVERTIVGSIQLQHLDTNETVQYLVNTQVQVQVQTQPVQTFAEKFNLVGKGSPVHISQETRDKVQALVRESKRIIEAGEDWAKTTKWRFGVAQ